MSSYGLAQFLREMSRMVELTETDDERVAEAERLVGKLVRGESSWLGAHQRMPAAEGYARHPLYCDPQDRFEVIALVWQPGQSTALHDHDGTWGAEGVVCGRMRVTNFEQVRQLPDGRVELRPLGDMIVSARETGQLLPPADCHIVANDGDEPAITIHVYGKQLKGFRIFNPDSEPNLYRVTTQSLAVRFSDVAWYV